MQATIEDNDLHLLAFDPTYASTPWAPDVVASYRRVLDLLFSARDLRDLQNLRALQLEQDGEVASAHLTATHRLRFRLTARPDEQHLVIEHIYEVRKDGSRS